MRNLIIVALLFCSFYSQAARSRSKYRSKQPDLSKFSTFFLGYETNKFEEDSEIKKSRLTIMVGKNLIRKGKYIGFYGMMLGVDYSSAGGPVLSPAVQYGYKLFKKTPFSIEVDALIKVLYGFKSEDIVLLSGEIGVSKEVMLIKRKSRNRNKPPRVWSFLIRGGISKSNLLASDSEASENYGIVPFVDVGFRSYL